MQVPTKQHPLSAHALYKRHKQDKGSTNAKIKSWDFKWSACK